ncbi:putative amidoligase enzyme-domain-containing protein [Xylariomycetidae sp. FL2044]|nr:putative amidoligase enzyme-domain-containing protein [Xylariomycetidae sp. FL2044]
MAPRTFGVELEFVLFFTRHEDEPKSSSSSSSSATDGGDHDHDHDHDYARILNIPPGSVVCPSAGSSPGSDDVIMDEYDTAVALVQKVVDQYVAQLPSTHRGKKPAPAPGTSLEKYRDWTVTTDPSVWLGAAHPRAYAGLYDVGMELVSPVFYSAASSYREVEAVTDMVRTFFRAAVNPSCGLHVHVGTETGFLPLATTRNLAAVCFAADHVLDRVHPAVRRHAEHCLSPRIYSALARGVVPPGRVAAGPNNPTKRRQPRGGRRRRPIGIRKRKPKPKPTKTLLIRLKQHTTTPTTTTTTAARNQPHRTTAGSFQRTLPRTTRAANISRRAAELSRVYKAFPWDFVHARLPEPRPPKPRPQTANSNSNSKVPPGSTAAATAAAVETILSSRTMSDVQALMATANDGAYNFDNARPARHQWGCEELRTVEFKQAAGTLDGGWAGTWARICVGMVEFAGSATPERVRRLIHSCCCDPDHSPPGGENDKENEGGGKNSEYYDVLDLLLDMGVREDDVEAVQRRLEGWEEVLEEEIYGVFCRGSGGGGGDIVLGDVKAFADAFGMLLPRQVEDWVVRRMNALCAEMVEEQGEGEEEEEEEEEFDYGDYGVEYTVAA